MASRTLSADLSDNIPDALRLVSSARLDARLPPFLVPSAEGAPDELTFQLGEADLIIESPMRTEPDIYVASIRAGFYVDFSEGELTLGLSGEGTEIRFELRQAQDGRPILPATSLSSLVEQNLWPEIERNLGEILSVDLDAVSVDSDSIKAIIPSFERLDIRPIFDELPKAKEGWIIGGGRSEIDLYFAQ